MDELNTCPLCLNQVSHISDKYHCETCNTDFSKMSDNSILVEHVGSIPKNEWIIQSD